MRTTFLVLAALFSASGCKSYRGDPNIHEALLNKTGTVPKAGTGNPDNPATPGDDPLPDNTLIIKNLNLPNEVAQYNRTCVSVKTDGEADKIIPDYKLETPIPITPGKSYTVNIDLFLDQDFRYTTSTCATGKTFDASKGRNIFSVPVCVDPMDTAQATAGCNP